jgi:hypothetical protein
MTTKVPFDIFLETFNLKNKCTPSRYAVKPYPHAVYEDIGQVLTPVLQCLDTFTYKERYTDLYKMYQTEEILSAELNECLSNLFPFSRNDEFEISGLYLSSQIYEKSSYLLCHDDQLDDRLFAFVFYLHTKDDVSAEDGGTLDLFKRNALGEPDGVVDQILPKRLSLALFEVSPRSFHQVSEVLGAGFVRRSLGGWIRGTYKFADKNFAAADFENLQNFLNGLTLSSLTDYFLLDSKYKPVTVEVPSGYIPAFYFFIECSFFDETSFFLDFLLDPQTDYYTYAHELLDSRISGCKLTKVCESFRMIDQVPGTKMSIIPGECGFFLLKCRRR